MKYITILLLIVHYLVELLYILVLIPYSVIFVFFKTIIQKHCLLNYLLTIISIIIIHDFI